MSLLFPNVTFRITCCFIGSLGELDTVGKQYRAKPFVSVSGELIFSSYDL